MGRTKRTDHRGNHRGAKKRAHSDCWYMPSIGNDSDFHDGESFGLTLVTEDRFIEDVQIGDDDSDEAADVDEYGDGGYLDFGAHASYATRRRAS